MIEAYINGIRQVPGIDFVARGNSISFMSPPAAGDGIQIVHNGYSICNLTGNGTTFLFTGPFADAGQQDELIDLLRQAFDYRNNTAVADVLERLRVVVELVKQECPTN
jgi:hypothetical protein